MALRIPAAPGRLFSLCLFLIISLAIGAQPFEFGPPTFRDDCETLEFCATGAQQPGFLYVFRSFDANGNQVEQSTAQTNPCWRITQPASTVTGIAFRFLNQQFEIEPSVLPGSVSSFFRLTATSTNPTVCPHRSRVIGVSAARCIGTDDWSRTVFGYNGAPINGISVLIRNERITQPNVIGLRSDMDLVIADGTGFRPGDLYRVRVTGRVGLSNRSGSVNIYVNTSNSCTFPGGGGGIIILNENSDLSEEEVLLLERAATTGLTDEEWEANDVDGLLERAYDIDHSRTTVHTGTLDVAPQLQVFPNPASGSVNLRYDVRPDRIDLIDLTGRQLRSLSGSRLGDYGGRLDLGDVPPGIYLVAATSGGERSVTRLRVQ